MITKWREELAGELFSSDEEASEVIAVYQELLAAEWPETDVTVLQSVFQNGGVIEVELDGETYIKRHFDTIPEEVEMYVEASRKVFYKAFGC